jgi:hypothetical protein
MRPIGHRILPMLATTALLGALLAVLPAGPAAAAISDHGRTEDDKAWFDSGQNRYYYMHVRHKVQVDTTPSPDRWHYVSRGWCTYTAGNGSTHYATRCNMNFFNASLTVCDFGHSCPATAFEPWGSRDFECDDDNDCVFSGSWHDEPQAHDGVWAITDSIQFRFLASTGQHLTNIYSHCSNAVNVDTYAEYGPACSSLM